MTNNHGLIYGYLRDHNLSSEEYYDLLAIGLCKAGIYFDKKKNVEFTTFAYKIMDNIMKSQYRYEGAQCRQFFAQPLVIEDEENEVYELPIPDNRNDYEEMVDDILIKDFLQTIKNPKEKLIIKKLCMGYTRTEIAQLLSMSVKGVGLYIKDIKRDWMRYKNIEKLTNISPDYYKQYMQATI